LEQHDRRLVPQFILDQFARGELDGRFPAAGLFFDLSGFTHLTESLMSHGTYGAEILASLVEAVFAPLVDTVFAHDGFVASFHGDAFTALFPARDGDEPDAAWRAIACAWRMRERFAGLVTRQTPFGEFQLAAKIGVATGEAEWSILASESEGRAAYNFRGTAVTHCAHAEDQAAKNDIILTPAMLRVVGERVAVEVIGDYLRLNGLPAPLPDSTLPAVPRPSRQALGLFLPAAILDLSLRGEFRQVISLFINLEGAPHVVELLGFAELCFALQRRYGGFFHRIIFDDKGCNLQLFWGAPINHEGDIARALNFILDLRRRYRTAIRAGLTYRMAFAGFIGSPLYEEYSCYSRGVNLAARLMSNAEWGEIYLSREVVERATEACRTEYLGERTFKGVATPQAVYRLVDYGGGARPAFYHGRLVGRESEMEELEQAVGPLFDGRFAGAVAIVAEAGRGKSRLAHEFLTALEESGRCRVLRCQTDDILRQPLNPFRYALRGYFDQSPQEDGDANRRRFEQILAGLIDATADPDLRAEIDRTRSFLGSLVDLRWPDSLYEQVDPQLRAPNTFEALKALFKAESLRRPLVLLLEDAHVLDSSSREFLAILTRQIDGYPLALLATSRQELDLDLFDPDAPRHTIRLRALPESAVEAMIEAAIGEPPPPALVQRITAGVAGNPLFVEQLLLYLRNNDLLDAYAQASPTPGRSNVHLPGDVRSLLVAQIDQLPPALRQATQVASVLGREFDAAVLSSMLHKSREEIDRTLALGVDRDIWHPLEGERYLFHHALLRDAAYEMQLTARRRDLHHLAADALAAGVAAAQPAIARLGEIAHHYDRADMAEAAGLYYGQAGESAAADYFNEQALAYYDRALELTAPLDLEPRYRLLLSREAIYGLIGRRDEQSADLAALEALLEQQPRAERRADVLLRRAAFSLALGDYAEAIVQAGQSAVVAETSGDSLAELKAVHRVGRALWQQGRSVESEPYLRRALALAEAGGYRPQKAECLYDLGMMSQYRGHYQTAFGFALEAQEIFQTVANRQGEVRCLNLIGNTFYARGDYLESQTAYESALSLTREIGWRYAETTLLANLGNNQFELGSFAVARDYYRQAVELSRQTGDKERESVALDSLGLTEHYGGDLERARGHYEEGLALAEQIGNNRNCGYTLTHLGFTLLELGRPDAAAAGFGRALGYRRQSGNEASVMDTLAGLAAAAMARGDLAEARQAVEQIVAWIDANGPEGLELPVQVYLICHDVLRQAAEQDAAAAEAAQLILEAGHDLLRQRASRINDPTLRRQFLEQVPFNARLQSAWAAARAGASSA